MSARKNCNIDDVAKEAGLKPMRCPHCGNAIEIRGALDSFLKAIVDLALAGRRIILKDFGIFQSRLLKGHTIDSPVAGGKRTFGDTNTLRFKMALEAKRMFNPDRFANKGQ